MLQYLGQPYFARRDRTREVEALQATNIKIGMAFFFGRHLQSGIGGAEINGDWALVAFELNMTQKPPLACGSTSFRQIVHRGPCQSKWK